MIISEIGEIYRFNHPKKLVAFAGIDPSIYESGRFKGTVNRITKRGSSRLRRALYLAVKCAIGDCRKKKTTNEIIPRNKRLREFYDKKREEGKPFKVAVIACANKLLQWIYAILKSNSTCLRHFIKRLTPEFSICRCDGSHNKAPSVIAFIFTPPKLAISFSLFPKDNSHFSKIALNF